MQAISQNAIMFAVVAITLGIGATILADIQADQVTGAAGCNSTVKTSCGYDYNASQAGLGSIATFSDNLTTLALVIVFGIILFYLGRYLMPGS